MPAVVYIAEYTTKYPFSGDLVRAEYGVWNSDGSCRASSDVTALVRAEHRFIVTNERMGGDPLAGPQKNLKLTFAGEATCYMPEMGWVTYMAGRVLRARYGCGSSWMDVSSRIGTAPAAYNDKLGCDPAVGEKKTLEITYGS